MLCQLRKDCLEKNDYNGLVKLVEQREAKEKKRGRVIDGSNYREVDDGEYEDDEEAPELVPAEDESQADEADEGATGVEEALDDGWSVVSSKKGKNKRR